MIACFNLASRLSRVRRFWDFDSCILTKRARLNHPGWLGGDELLPEDLRSHPDGILSQGFSIS